jgi:hypothetical protein
MTLTSLLDSATDWWAAYGPVVLTVAAVATVGLVIVAVVAIVRSEQRDRWVSGVTALVVLAWTSEGLWEVARQALGLPVAFAIMTFFVFEAMMVSSAMQAERHRARHGTPGPAGQYVWVLAGVTALIVALNAATLVEAVLRFALPLAAAGLWWVGVTAERDSDTAEVRQRRAEAAARREATWAITPNTALVWLKLKRPGVVDVTAGERERRIQRMVKAADRYATAPAGSRTARRAAAKLRKLARRATARDVTEVAARVARTTGIVELVVPDMTAVTPPVDAAILSASWPAIEAVTTGEMTAREAAMDTPDEAVMTGHRGRRQRSNRAAKTARQRGHDRVQMAADIVATRPDISGAELAERLGLKDRQGRRLKTLAEQRLTALGRPANGHVPDMTADAVAAMTAEDGRP